MYEDYEQRLLTPEEYTFLSEEYNGKIKSYEEQINQLKKRVDSYKPDFTGNEEWREKSKKFAKRETLNREMVEAFIRRIDVADEIHIKIQMNCMDEFKKLLEVKERRRLEFNE